jgi:hypothetical protein
MAMLQQIQLMVRVTRVQQCLWSRPGLASVEWGCAQ